MINKKDTHGNPLPNKNWICKSCGKNCFTDDRDYYMVKHHIWEQHGCGKGMLCMNCMETRLGHKITADEILPCPLTLWINQYTAEILNKAKIYY